jgi:hypothetical protein
MDHVALTPLILRCDLGLSVLLTMSANWGTSERMCSPRVLLPLTPFGHGDQISTHLSGGGFRQRARNAGVTGLVLMHTRTMNISVNRWAAS